MHLVSESFQTILFVFLLSLTLQLLLVSLLLSLLQRILPKQHPGGNTEGVGQIQAVPLSLYQQLLLLPDTVWPPAVEVFMDGSAISCPSWLSRLPIVLYSHFRQASPRLTLVLSLTTCVLFPKVTLVTLEKGKTIIIIA